jgi:predicted Zn-dependent peptidase
MSAFANEESIGSIDQQHISSFLKNKLTLGGATLFISGDAGKAEIEAIENLMAKYAPRAITSIPLLSEEKAISYEDTHVKHRVDHTTQVSLMMGKRIPAFTEKEMHTANLTNILLGGFFGSRLMQEIREERGLTYGIGSYISQSTDGNNWFISGEMNSSNTEAALEAMAEIMVSMRKNTPTGDELDKAKRYFAGQFRSGFDGPFSLPRKIQTLMLRGYDYSYYDTTLQDLWNTTTNEICQFSDNYLHPESFAVVLAGDTKPTLDLESR